MATCVKCKCDGFGPWCERCAESFLYGAPDERPFTPEIVAKYEEVVVATRVRDHRTVDSIEVAL